MFTCRLSVLLLLNSAVATVGMIQTHAGPEPGAVEQPHWPVGIVELIRHESRVFSVWVNGNEHYYFNATSAQVNRLIKLYSNSRIRDHVLRITAAKPKEEVSRDTGRYNVCLDLDDETFEPTLTVYVDLPADRLLAEAITLPGNIILNNEVAGLSLKAKATKPKRAIYHAQILFEDGAPAFDLQHGVMTKITWWEKGVKEGIRICGVWAKGNVTISLSEGEIADLKANRTWLTATVGNDLTQVRSNHPRVGWNNLSAEGKPIEPFRVERPRLYYGRVLFEDGGPADRVWWGMRPIRLLFTYAGPVEVGSDGYFAVCFTDDQFDKAKLDDAPDNVYIPDNTDTHGGTAHYSFPVSKLTQDKAKADVLRIAKPRT